MNATTGGTNWAGNVRYTARHVHRPETIDELRRVVADATKVRAIGTGHSFNLIADASPDGPGDLVSLAGLPQVIDIDSATRTVTVGGAVRYGDLAIALHAAGYAVHNLASLPHISVAGAVATGTHGSGTGNLATAVTAIEMVTAGGDLRTLRRDTDGDAFAAAVVGLGALGVVTRLTLRIEPAYEVAQWVYEGMPWERLLANVDDVFASAYSVSVLTRWDVPRVDYVWRKHRLDTTRAPIGENVTDTWLDATLATVERHPVVGLPPEPCTPQQGVPGPWHERLPHFRLDFTPSVGAEVQSEFLVAFDHARAAIAAMREIGEHLTPLLRVSELRSVSADDLWLSSGYRRDSLGIHFTWADNVPGVVAVLPVVQAALAPFAPRPHWGKLFTIAPEPVAAAYPRIDDFGELRSRLDPDAKFGNAFVDRYAPAAGH
ncbi:MAG TPA: FAD-binding protein [Micromonosporaceae bacterium]